MVNRRNKGPGWNYGPIKINGKTPTDFSGVAFHSVLHVRSMCFLVTLISACSASFFKAYLVRGQLHGLWQYLRYLFCTDKFQVSLSHLSLSFLSSGHCFPYASWNLLCFLLSASYRSAAIHVTWRPGSRKDVYGLFHGHRS